MKVVGEVKDFRPLAIAGDCSRLRVGWMWAGVGMMALAFFSLLARFPFECELCCAVTALSYVAGGMRSGILSG